MRLPSFTALCLLGCTQDFGVFDGTPDGGDGGSDSQQAADAPDGSDASSPDGSSCATQQCLGAAHGCGINCGNASSLCQTKCDADPMCIAACKATEASCRQPCVQSCIACSAGAPCDVTAACKSASGA